MFPFLIGLAKFTVDSIDTSICTHVIYAFNILNPFTYLMDSKDPTFDSNNYGKFVGLKNKNQNLKVLMAIGGWTDSKEDLANTEKYSDMIRSASRRSKFIK